jgi:hypothetical protein
MYKITEVSKSSLFRKQGLKPCISGAEDADADIIFPFSSFPSGWWGEEENLIRRQQNELRASQEAKPVWSEGLTDLAGLRLIWS